MKGTLRAGSLVLPALGLAAIAMISNSHHLSVSVHAQDNPKQPAYYTAKVQPILETNCYRCHGNANHRGAFNMDTRENMIKGGHHGPGLVPEHPEQSWMVKLIRHEGPADDPMNMPPAPKPKLSDADIAVITAWIQAGAVMPPTPPAAAATPTP